MAADRVDACEAHEASRLSARPDNPITQTGVRAEFSPNGLRSWLGQKRADPIHQALDLVIIGARSCSPVD